MNKRATSFILSNNITDRLVSIYKIAAKNSLIELQNEIETSQSLIKKFLEQFASLVLSLFTLISFSIMLFVVKIIKNKITKRVDKIQIEINKIQRDFIQDP
jgi:hypothetical protein